MAIKALLVVILPVWILPWAGSRLNAAPPQGRGPDALPLLTLTRPAAGRLAPNERACFGLDLQQGEFVRIFAATPNGVFRVRAFEPDCTEPLQTTWIWSFFPSLPLAFEAASTGRYVLELTHPSFDADKISTLQYTVQVDEWQSAATRTALHEDLHRDPRVAWLRKNTVAIRSMDFEDGDFSDFSSLQKALSAARIVLLGEADHGDGSDFKLKSRLVKFLHRTMGFDVLAFESGMFGAWMAWRGLQTEAHPQDAFQKGIMRVWSSSEQMQTLIRYIAESARTDRPLELTGLDSQFTGSATLQFVPALRDFLNRSRIESPLADEDSAAAKLLSSVLDGSLAANRTSLPAEGEERELTEALRRTARQIEVRVVGRDAALWAQMLRSAAAQVPLEIRNLRDPDDAAYAEMRDRQMAANLLWLLNTHYRGRKIIVWCHTAHAVRNRQHTSFCRMQGFTMGHGVWEALGGTSFVIGFTSYGGAALWTTQRPEFRQDIVSDQNPQFEFEELMEAAGHELAMVNLREARERGDWMGGTFLARPLHHITERAPWSDLLDVLVFIRTQEPSRAVDVP